MFDEKYYHDEDEQSEDLEDQHDINMQLMNDTTNIK
jgi:hypothetical protein